MQTPNTNSKYLDIWRTITNSIQRWKVTTLYCAVQKSSLEKIAKLVPLKIEQERNRGVIWSKKSRMRIAVEDVVLVKRDKKTKTQMEIRNCERTISKKDGVIRAVCKKERQIKRLFRAWRTKDANLTRIIFKSAWK